MKAHIRKNAISGVLTLVLALSGATVFADTAAPPQPPADAGAPVALSALFAPYVSSGVLTQSELDAIASYVAAEDAARKTEMDAFRNLTVEQRKAQMTGERKAPETFRQQFLDEGLITEAQAAAIDWTKIERPARTEGGGPDAVTGATQKTEGKASGTAAVKAAEGITVLINGTEVAGTVKSHADKNGRTLIELRSVAEALGAELSWDAATQTVTLTSADQTVTIRINQSAYHVNGVEKTMDTAAVIESGHTMVPVRVIAEALGATVAYDAATHTVTITQ